MPGPDVSCVIMFADIAGSTRLFESLGDAKAREIIARCLGCLSDITREHGGTVVKTIGDEIMTRYPDADAAVASALTMQSATVETPHVCLIPMALRIGMHIGPTLQEGGDVFGDAVNVAARMVAIARPGQIIVTEEVFRRLSKGLSARARWFDHARVKGRHEAITMYVVVWEEEPIVTHMAESSERRPTEADRQLRLRYGDKEVRLDQSSAPFIIGRGERCDLTVRTRFASRLHARIEHRHGNFVLIDESTNGTCVRPRDGRQIYLRREELALSGTGVISLGRSASKQAGDLIHFQCD
jgi:class 3 adenylate cyclase